MDDGRRRCEWAVKPGSLMSEYHDTEWGVPTHGGRALFELLCLEGAQAGLSWNTVLNRREGYRIAFDGFEIESVAAFDDARAEALRCDERIIRNRAKIRAFIDNAALVLAIAKEGSSLDDYLWSLAGGATLVNRWQNMSDLPSETEVSRNMSKTLKAKGFRFVGPTICYAFMQSAGMVNDHLVDCFRYSEVGVG
jgi:DNA-3-methyladenine glycosylase I